MNPHAQAAAASTTALPRFDRLARVYRWMEWFSFGPLLSRCRGWFLPLLRSRRRALVLGDGDGRFTARLLRTNSSIHIDAVDCSPAMLRALQRRAGLHANRIQTHSADIRSWRPSNTGYDLVITHFFLDCLATDEVASLAKRIQSHTDASVLWVVSEFSIPPDGWGRFLARLLISVLYLAFGMLTELRTRSLPDHHRALNSAGFILARRRDFLGGLLVSEVWEYRTLQEC